MTAWCLPPASHFCNFDPMRCSERPLRWSKALGWPAASVNTAWAVASIRFVSFGARSINTPR